MRLLPRVLILALISVLFISYQNFSSVGPSEWDSTSSLKIIHEMNTFQAGDKGLPETFAAPQGGSDLESVRNDWMQRQGTILLNGYDKKLEKALNEKLNSWVYEITRKEEPAESPSASANGDVNASDNHSQASSSSKMKQNLRVMRINSLKYDLGENTCMNLTADPGNTRFDLSQTLSQNTKLGVEHRTADSKTQMFLKYEW